MKFSAPVMMNQIAIQLLLFSTQRPAHRPARSRDGDAHPAVGQTAFGRLAGAADAPTRLHTGLFIALAAAVLVWLLLWRTPLGYRIRAVGQSREASRYAGISVPIYLTLALTLSGALAGLAGAVELIGRARAAWWRASLSATDSPALWWRSSGGCIRWVRFPLLSFLARCSPAQSACSAPFRCLPRPSSPSRGIVVLFVVSSDLWVRRRTARRVAQMVGASAGADSGPDVAASSRAGQGNDGAQNAHCWRFWSRLPP